MAPMWRYGVLFVVTGDAVDEQTVQGIIGANPGNQYNISGVAYNATLYAYRVLGCNGGTESTGQLPFLPQKSPD